MHPGRTRAFGRSIPVIRKRQDNSAESAAWKFFSASLGTSAPSLPFCLALVFPRFASLLLPHSLTQLSTHLIHPHLLHHLIHPAFDAVLSSNYTLQLLNVSEFISSRFDREKATLKNHLLVSFPTTGESHSKKRVGRELVYVFVLRQRFRTPPAAQAATVSLRAETL
ncbi:hypothetical protein V6Z92_002656 [Aspergillus fumigatus]